MTVAALRRWVELVTAGEFAGFLVPACVGALAVAAGAGGWLLYVLMVMAGAVEGLVLGLFQSRALAHARVSVSRARWAGLTSAAAALAWALGMLPSTLSRVDYTSPGGLVLVATGGATLLCSIPAAQWLELRRATQRAALWIPVNVVAWTLGLTWTFAPSPFVDESTGTVELFGIYAMAGLLMALTMAVVTGVGLRTCVLAQAGPPRTWARTLLVLACLAGASVVFVLLDQAYVGLVDAQVGQVAGSATRATEHGLVSRLHLVVPLLALALWRPSILALRRGKIWRHRWRLVLLCLANCGLVGGYLLVTGGVTPFSGDEWLVTEVVIVPVVEEAVWRGLVLTVLVALLRRVHPAGRATTIAVWSAGLAFGLLHGANALTGTPLSFVGIQVVNAAVWGVVYGYARAWTNSVFPPMVLHAAMNLVVVLL